MALRSPWGMCVRQTQQRRLGQEHHKPEVGSREQYPARSEAPKELLKFAATQKVIDLIETQVQAVFREAVQTLLVEYCSGVTFCLLFPKLDPIFHVSEE